MQVVARSLLCFKAAIRLMLGHDLDKQRSGS